MLGFGRQVSFGLAGWLWADLLLGLFAIFLAANAVAPQVVAKQGIDPKPVELRIAVTGSLLLSDDPAVAAAEQQRVADAVRSQLASVAPGRRVAIVFAYGSHAEAAQGDRMAALAIAPLVDGQFAGAVLRAYHELNPDDPGSSVAFEIYLNE